MDGSFILLSPSPLGSLLGGSCFHSSSSFLLLLLLPLFVALGAPRVSPLFGNLIGLFEKGIQEGCASQLNPLHHERAHEHLEEWVMKLSGTALIDTCVRYWYVGRSSPYFTAARSGLWSVHHSFMYSIWSRRVHLCIFSLPI